MQVDVQTTRSGENPFQALTSSSGVTSLKGFEGFMAIFQKMLESVQGGIEAADGNAEMNVNDLIQQNPELWENLSSEQEQMMDLLSQISPASLQMLLGSIELKGESEMSEQMLDLDAVLQLFQEGLSLQNISEGGATDLDEFEDSLIRLDQVWKMMKELGIDLENFEQTSEIKAQDLLKSLQDFISEMQKLLNALQENDENSESTDEPAYDAEKLESILQDAQAMLQALLLSQNENQAEQEKTIDNLYQELDGVNPQAGEIDSDSELSFESSWMNADSEISTTENFSENRNPDSSSLEQKNVKTSTPFSTLEQKSDVLKMDENQKELSKESWNISKESVITQGQNQEQAAQNNAEQNSQRQEDRILEASSLNPAQSKDEQIGRQYEKIQELLERTVQNSESTGSAGDADIEGVSTPKAGVDQLARIQSIRAVQQVSHRVQFMISQGEGTATLRLDPPELGKIDLNVEYKSGELKVHMVVENQAVKETLELQVQQLRENLEAQQVKLHKLEVQVDQHQQQSSGERNGASSRRSARNTRGMKFAKVTVEAPIPDTGRRFGYNTMEFIA